MTRAQNYCDCGAEESAAELRYGGGVCDDEAIDLATLDRPYFDLDGNEGTHSEVYS
jgi:hypothetical protein